MPLALMGLPMAVSSRARASAPPALAIARETGSVEDDMAQTHNCPPRYLGARTILCKNRSFLLTRALATTAAMGTSKAILPIMAIRGWQ
jgi:hypothetical protein